MPGETRLDLLRDNAGRIRSICASLKKWKNGTLVLIISNPVDVLTQIAADELNWEVRALGSGASLDTARLKTLIGEKLGLDPHSIHIWALLGYALFARRAPAAGPSPVRLLSSA